MSTDDRGGCSKVHTTVPMIDQSITALLSITHSACSKIKTCLLAGRRNESGEFSFEREREREPSEKDTH